MALRPFITMILVGLSLQAQASSGKPLSEAQKKAAQSAQSLIIADFAHGSESMLRYELTLLKQIKEADPRFDCVFLEVEPKAEKSIEAFLGGVGYAESVGLWIDETSRKMEVTFTNVIPDWFLKEVHKLGYKIRGADIDWDSELGAKTIPLVRKYDKSSISLSEYGPLMVGERSRVMAERLILSLKEGSCQKAALVVGDGHLHAGTGFKPVQAYLIEAGVTGFFWN